MRESLTEARVNGRMKRTRYNLFCSDPFKQRSKKPFCRHRLRPATTLLRPATWSVIAGITAITSPRSVAVIVRCLDTVTCQQPTSHNATQQCCDPQPSCCDPQPVLCPTTYMLRSADKYFSYTIESHSMYQSVSLTLLIMSHIINYSMCNLSKGATSQDPCHDRQ